MYALLKLLCSILPKCSTRGLLAYKYVITWKNIMRFLIVISKPVIMRAMLHISSITIMIVSDFSLIRMNWICVINHIPQCRRIKRLGNLSSFVCSFNLTRLYIIWHNLSLFNYERYSIDFRTCIQSVVSHKR